MTGRITALRPFDPSDPDTPTNTLLIQHDIQASGGTSGSAIVDKAGQVIAVNNAGTTDESASNRFAIRADLVRVFLADIDAGHVEPLTIDRTGTNRGNQPPAATCPAASWHSQAFGFGFNPPTGFFGPVADDNPDADDLFARDFVFDELLQIDINVFAWSPSGCSRKAGSPGRPCFGAPTGRTLSRSAVAWAG